MKVEHARPAGEPDSLVGRTRRALLAAQERAGGASVAQDAPVDGGKDVQTQVVDDVRTPEPLAGKASAPDPAKAEETDTNAAAARRGIPLLALALAVLVIAAAVFATVAGVSWYRAGHDSARDVAAARDKISLAARVDIATVNTSDYRKPAASITSWQSVATGSLASQFTRQRNTAISVLTKARVITRATVLDAAVTDLDVAKGTATVIASVNVVRTAVTGGSATTRNRFEAAMSRVGGEWKLANLTIVSVQLS